MSRYVESETVELKAEYTDDFIRDVVSFLNAEGGVVYFGVREDGTVVGVENADDLAESVSASIAKQIRPNPRRETATEILHEENLSILAVTVKKGSRPLYCVKIDGFSSKGSLVRAGTSHKELSPEEILARYRAYFFDDDYEDAMLQAPSKSADLSFETLKSMLTDRGFEIDEETFETSFHLRSADGAYNQLAELLADQQELSLVFDRQIPAGFGVCCETSDYGGEGLARGYQKTKERLDSEKVYFPRNADDSSADGLLLYDMRCVNEALANMLIHNDWTVAEPKVDLYMPRLVLTSYGGLPRGMTKREFYCGVSRPRNPGLAMVFSCLGLTGQKGRGVPTIIRKYGKKAFKIHDDHIDVIIPVNPEFWNRPTLREIFIGELETEIMVWIFMLAPMALIVLVGAVLLLLLEILLKTLF